jgi:hypothetical protein
MIIFIERDAVPNKKTLEQQFKFLKSKDLDDIYRWMKEKRELCVQNGSNSTNCAIQQVYKYSGVIITNDHLSEFRTWAYGYDSLIFKEEYASDTITPIIYGEQQKQLYHKPRKQKINKM